MEPIMTPAEQHYSDKLYACGVPPHLHAGLIAYLTAGISQDRFLVAVLDNNLGRAVAAGDAHSVAGLRNLSVFLSNHAPHTAWGSSDKVAKWLATFHKERV